MLRGPHPRIRKTIKWGGAALTVLLVVVWIASGWYGVRYWTPNSLTVRIEAGRAEVLINRASLFDTTQGQWSWYASGEQFRWRPQSRRISTYRWLYMPVWVPALLSFLITSIAFGLDARARRHARMNLCKTCGYDRTGISHETKCPECGSTPS